jgi:hypothetical protein
MRIMMKATIHVIILSLISLLAISPMILAFTAMLVAGINGCTLNESGAHPCVIFGTDYGETLLGMMISLWLLMVTCPAGAVLIIVYVIIAGVITFFAKRRNKSH